MRYCKRILTTLVIVIFIVSTMAVQTLADSDLAIPSNLEASAASNSVTLTWDAVPGAEQYFIAEVGIQSFTVDAPATAFTVTGLQPGTSYSFRVMAVNGSGYSDWCDPVTVTTVPAIPSNLKVTAESDTVTLTWDAVPGAEQYYIAEVGIQSFTVDAPATTFTVTGLQPGTTYSFRVMAINNSGNSDWCDPVTVTTVPAIPSNLQVTASGNTVTLTWDSVPGADKYYIAEVGIQSFTVDAPATSYTVTGLQPGTTYSFRVMAVNSSGNSDWCDPVTVTTVQQAE